MKFIDLTGERFNKLVVIERVCHPSNPKSKSTYWKCRCDCGNYTIVDGSKLKSGHTKSCGCLLKNTNGIDHINFKGNKWILQENIAIGKDSNNCIFTISIEDFDFVKKYCWTASKSRKTKTGKYFCSRMGRNSDNKHKMKMLHNFIWELHNGDIPKGCYIDHIDQNPSNNQINNLRLVTKSMNSFNSPVRNNNVSGVTGVSWENRSNKWRAYITKNHKRIELGLYETLEEATNIRKQAEIKYYGEYSKK